MKKILITIVAVLVLACTLAFSATAADYEHLADELNALGLLKGTGNGYDLDRAPNRGEALAMLIRLYGLEDEALACKLSHPFTDVPAWLSPYVAYAYANKLTTGMSATGYGSSALCSAQMYVTFVLRALGYDDAAGDFDYADAIEFGEKIGIIDEIIDSGEFLRDQMVAVSYSALTAAPKETKFATLLDKLIDDGAVNTAASADMMKKIALFKELATVGSELSDMTSVAMKMGMDINASIMGDATAIKMDADIGMIVKSPDIQLAMTLDASVMDEELSMGVYIKDGYVYVDDGDSKVKLEAGLEDLDLDELLAMSDTSQAAPNFSLFITSITKTTEGGLTVYSTSLAAGLLNDIIGMALELAGGTNIGDTGAGVSDFSLSKAEIKYYLDSGGALKKCSMAIDLSMKIDAGGLKMPLLLKSKFDIEITAVGDAVVLKFPSDLGDYISGDFDSLIPMAGIFA